MKTHNITINAVPEDRLELLQAKADRYGQMVGVKVKVSAYVRMLIDRDLKTAEDKLKGSKWRIRK